MKNLTKHWKLKLSLGITIAIVVFILGLIVQEYVITHSFKLQTPLLIERNQIISPLASKSAGLVYAQEVKNPYNEKSPKGVAWKLNMEKFGIEFWGSLEELIRRESTWNPYAINKSSGACGLAQALPCSKMGCELWDYECQIEWMLDYIDNRYGNPNKALDFHNLKNWY